MKLNKNRVYSLCVIAFACILLRETSRLQSLFSIASQDVGPKFFPYAIGVGLIICAVGKFITEGGESKPLFTGVGWKRTIIIFAAIALYLIALQYIGYLISTPVFAAVFVLLMKENRKINPVALVLFALATTAVLYVVFEKLILVFLPSGVIFG